MSLRFTATEKLKEIEREISMRRRVYPRWVLDKKLKQTDADRQIFILEQIASDYRAQAEAENPQGKLV